MTITLVIRPELQAELARQAAAQGMAIDSYATGLLEEAVHLPVAGPLEVERSPRVAAIERLKTFGQTHGLALGGVTLRELRHEARP